MYFCKKIINEDGEAVIKNGDCTNRRKRGYILVQNTMNFFKLQSGGVITYDDLEKNNNIELAKKYGVSRERIRQIRKIMKLPSLKEEHAEKKEFKIAQYLIKNPNNIKITALAESCQCSTSFNELTRIAANYNINITFYIENIIEFEHGITKYSSKKCKCDICKLGNIISQKFWRIGVKSYVVNYLANTYINEYKKYQTLRKQPFFAMLRNIITSLKMTNT